MFNFDGKGVGVGDESFCYAAESIDTAMERHLYLDKKLGCFVDDDVVEHVPSLIEFPLQSGDDFDESFWRGKVCEPQPLSHRHRSATGCSEQESPHVHHLVSCSEGACSRSPSY